MKKQSKLSLQRLIGVILFISLAFSVVYAFVHFLHAPEGMAHTKIKSDYLLMLTQCILGLIAPVLTGFLLAFLLSIPVNALEKRLIRPHGKRALRRLISVYFMCGG